MPRQLKRVHLGEKLSIRIDAARFIDKSDSTPRSSTVHLYGKDIDIFAREWDR